MPSFVRPGKYSGRRLLILALIATGLAVWASARFTSNVFAHQDAVSASQIVWRYFSQDTAEIERIARGDTPNPSFVETILRGLNANVFFCYRVYDVDGNLKYSASSLEGAPARLATGQENNPLAAQTARDRAPVTETGEFEQGGFTRYLAYSLVPVIRGEKVVAVQEIFLEQTARLNQLRDRISLLSVLAALLAALGFGIPAVAWRRRSTEIAEREQKMEQQAELFQTTLENLPLGVAMFDRDRRLLVSNAAYAEVYAVDPGLLAPGAEADDIRRLRNENAFLTETAGPAGGENVRLSNGIEATQEIWKLKNGRIVKTRRYPVPGGGWVSMHEDITDTLQREQELQHARQFLDTVIENVPVAIIVKDAQTLRYELVNRAVGQVHGLMADEIAGRLSTDFFSPAQAAAIDAADRAALSQPSQGAALAETLIETPGRGPRTIASRRIVVRTPQGGARWLITILEDVTERREAERQVQFLAHHDALTELANRARFNACLDAALATKAPGEGPAIALIDLDGFKEINDAFGHAAGDEVLRVIAQRLQRHAYERDLVARLGGDEFAVMFADIASEEELEPVMMDLIGNISEPIEFEGRTLVVEASAGMAFHSDGAADRHHLLRQADLALYEAKSQGKGVYCAFISQILERRLSRKTLEMDMHSAVAERRFEIHYQPIVDLRTGAIVSMEALVRWPHPERGLISPMDFIPVAEETGLIIPIGEIVLEKACQAASQWPAHVRLSVNLSPVQFRDSKLALKVAQVLMQTGMSPQRLELEITEAALLDDSFDNIQMLSELHEMGIRIVMDDFGTGYSSLNYLRNFPFDKIKIDRSYVRDLESGANHSRTILNAVLAIARGLDLSTTAEGVETQEQMDILRSAGCEEMQGYFFSRPVPEHDVAKLFADNQEAQAAFAQSPGRAA